MPRGIPSGTKPAVKKAKIAKKHLPQKTVLKPPAAPHSKAADVAKKAELKAMNLLEKAKSALSKADAAIAKATAKAKKTPASREAAAKSRAARAVAAVAVRAARAELKIVCATLELLPQSAAPSLGLKLLHAKVGAWLQRPVALAVCRKPHSQKRH